MMEFVFWASFALLFYIYFGYPLAVKAVAILKPNPIATNDDYLPTVSVLIAAYNEAKDIEATLRNKLALDYPPEKLEVLVISDESEDGTDRIVDAVAASTQVAIRLFRQVPRQGKTAGLNTLVPKATGDILLFSDANSQWDNQAVRKLCRNFADPEVGYVTGKMVYVNADGSVVGDGCSAYMKYENWLRGQETRIGSIVGVDGGIDGMRRELYQPLRADQLPDFVQPLKVVEQGYRVVYEPNALLKEEALNDTDSEFSMRVRVSLRALWALKDMRHLMNPLRDSSFAWKLVSHKLLRYMAFIPLCILSFSTILLAPACRIYTFAFIGMIIFIALAWVGHKREGDGQSLSFVYSIPYYFILLNIASYKATAAFLKGEKKVIWNPRKG